MAKRIITINRMFGSNGRLIGKTLAENLDIGFYDKELIDMAAKKNNIPFDTLAKVDEKKASQWVFPVDSELQFTDNFSFVPMNDHPVPSAERGLRNCRPLCNQYPEG